MKPTGMNRCRPEGPAGPRRALGGLIAAVLLASGCTPPATEDWQLGPFVRPAGVNPVLASDANSTFRCPLAGEVRWRGRAVFNPAAVVREGKVYLLFRAQDAAGTSRIGLAVSDDGLHFTPRPAPVLYPAEDAMKRVEWPGGCEDPRLVEAPDGRYVMTYTAYDGRTARLAVATSPDLLHWRKEGPAFPGEFRDRWTKAGAIVCRLAGGRLVAAKIGGRYWMYLRDSQFLAATSEDLLRWRVVRTPTGRPREVFLPRPGRFDSRLIEPGPPAVLRRDGILLLYNGVNAEALGDPAIPAGTFCGGQALMDAADPMRLLARAREPLLRPEMPFETTGQVANVCFLEGLVRFGGRWLLYYGTADSRIAVAVAPGRD